MSVPLTEFEKSIQSVHAARQVETDGQLAFILSDRQQLVNVVKVILGIENPERGDRHVRIVSDPDKAMVEISNNPSWKLLIACEVTAPSQPEHFHVSPIADAKHIGLEFVKGYNIDCESWFVETNPGTPPGGLKIELTLDAPTAGRVTRQAAAATEDVDIQELKDWIAKQVENTLSNV